MKLDIRNYMDFPMIFDIIQPKEIELYLYNIPRNFMINALKYVKSYSEINNVKVDLIDVDGVLN